MPPYYIIERLGDPAGPYDYVVYCGWADSHNAYYIPDDWVDYFKDVHGHMGYEFGRAWYQNNLNNKLYFKEKDYPFFIMKFGHMFTKRPWEI